MATQQQQTLNERLQQWDAFTKSEQFKALSRDDLEVISRKFMSQKVGTTDEWKAMPQDRRHAVIAKVRNIAPANPMDDGGVNASAGIVQGLSRGAKDTVEGIALGRVPQAKGLMDRMPNDLASPDLDPRHIPGFIQDAQASLAGGIAEPLASTNYALGAGVGYMTAGAASPIARGITAAVEKVAAPSLAALAGKAFSAGHAPVAGGITAAAPLIKGGLSGGIQGAAATVAGGDPSQAGANIGMGFALSALTAGRARQAPKPSAKTAAATSPEVPPQVTQGPDVQQVPDYLPDLVEMREVMAMRPGAVPQRPAGLPDSPYLDGLDTPDAPAGSRRAGPSQDEEIAAALLSREDFSNPNSLAAKLFYGEEGAFQAPGTRPRTAAEVAQAEAKKLRKQIVLGEQLLEQSAVGDRPGIQARIDELRTRLQTYGDVQDFATPPKAPRGNPAEVDPTEHANFAKLNLTDEEKAVFGRKVQEQVAEMGDSHKQRVTQEEYNRAAAAIDPALMDGMEPPKPGQVVDRSVFRAAQLHAEELSREITRQEAALAQGRGGMTADEVQSAQAQLDSLDRSLKKMLAITVPTRSEVARSLALMKAMGKDSWDSSYWVSRAQRIGGADVDSDGILSIVRRGHAAQEAGDADGVHAARVELAKAMAKIEVTDPWDAVSLTRKAGLLSSEQTLGTNVISNINNAAATEITRGLASIPDRILGQFTGKRAVLAPGWHAVKGSFQEARTRGWRQAGEIMNHGLPEQELARMEMQRELNTGIESWDKAVNFVFRLQGAADQPTKVYAFQRSIHDQARLKAMAEKKRNPMVDVEQRTQELINTPDEVMLTEAAADASIATFQNDTAIAQGLADLRRRLPPWARLLAFDPVATFVKTPTAFVASTIRHTPHGAAVDLALQGVKAARRMRADGEQARVRNLSADEQRKISMAMGRGMIGTGAWALGLMLGQAGVITGAYESSARETNEAAGRPPMSFRIGDVWVPLIILGPLGQVAGIAATWQAAQGDLGKAIKNTGRALIEMPMTEGARNVAKLAEDFTKVPEFYGKFATSFVPSASAQVARMFDGSQRDARDDDPVMATLKGAANRLPGARNLLPESKDALGRTIANDSSGPANVVPFRFSVARDQEPIVKELVRLGVKLPSAPKSLSRDGTAYALDDEHRRAFEEMRGEMLLGRLKNLTTDSLSDDRKLAVIKRVMKDVNTRAAQRYLAKHRRKLTPKQ